jgi:uncharacterized phage protein (TIGR02218 family)
MTYASRETGVCTGNPIELLKFTLLGQNWCYTSGDEEIGYNALTYSPAPLLRGVPEQAGKGGDSALTLIVPADMDVALLYRVYVPARSMGLTIYRKHRDDAEVICFWTGSVRCVTWKGATAELRCEPTSAGMKRDGLRYQYQATCNHMLYGDDCGKDQLLYKTVVTVDAIDGDAIQSEEFATKADGWFKSGYLMRGNDPRMMVSHIGDTVTLILPFEGLIPGERLDAYAGCDRSKATCIATFNNLVNYGGFPNIPTKNPFNKGLS